MARKVRVLDAYRVEGRLYEVAGEDGMLVVFDCGVGVDGADGVRYVHKAFVSRGYGVDDEGFRYPNRGYREETERFAERVRARGFIDLRYWDPVPPEPSLEEREEYNRRCEEDERSGA